MKDQQKKVDADSAVFAPVSTASIEEVNLRRIRGICTGVLALEAINLLNPNFWNTPILWTGAIFLSIVSACFLLLIIFRKPAAFFQRPYILNTLFWALLSVGFFPFLVRDARAGDSPLNCVLLCTVLICAPLLRVKSLSVIFATSTIINLLAALYAQGYTLTFQYSLELIAINAVGFFMAWNLHGRYFSLLDKQQQMYDRQLADKLASEALQSKLEQDRLVNAARSDFLARMSHDLRTPLNAVIGLSDIAMDPALSREETDEYLNDINSSAKHLLSLINDVLDITKLDSHKMTLHPESYAVHDFFNTVQSIIAIQCRQQNIRFQSGSDEGFPEYLLVDKLRFNQIFLNLLSNAIKFTPEGGSISLQLSHEALPDGRILLTGVVQDSGRGMEPEFAAHAFEAFAQENAEDSENGAGLGLTIVKNIVELMGGTIRIESRPNQGTGVTVSLPVSEEEKPAKQQESVSRRNILKGKRILLCEDHPLNQKVAAYLLEEGGMTSEIADNGMIGVSMFSRSTPGYYDAILMDVRMPVMDGIAATAAIRALPREDAATVPIIAITANAYEEDAEKSKAAGMTRISASLSNRRFCMKHSSSSCNRPYPGFS